ncbi:transcription initiation factor IIB [archaeon]|nr:MAG: transcription initiation factor IIB [archaeon]
MLSTQYRFLKRCPSCGSTRIMHDPETGEIYCENCGYVLMDHSINEGPEWRDFRDETTQKRDRSGGPLTPLLYDYGLTTNMGQGVKDASGRAMSVEELERARRLRVWHKRTRIAGSAERNISVATRYLSHITDKLDLPRSVLNRAAHIYREALEKGLIKGRPINSIAAASVYAACRDLGIPKTLKEVGDAAGLRKKDIARSYRLIVRYTEKVMPVADPILYVSKLASRLGVPPEVEARTKEILRKAQEMKIIAGKDPLGLAAAALYMATQQLGYTKFTQKQIAEAADVTEVTVRNRYKGLKEAFAEQEAT